MPKPAALDLFSLDPLENATFAAALSADRVTQWSVEGA